ncbi:MAG: hypothetical protein ABL986_17860 [Vicinamibacterales bacterium]
MLKTLTSVAVGLALTMGLSAPASASMSDKMTRFTFDRPIALPGVTLPPGTYVFKLADPTIERKVVQVLDERGMHSYALLQAVPAFRSDKEGEPSVSLMDTVPGMPAAIHSWWPVGESQGFEFIYSEEQYAKLTGVTDAPTVIDGGGIASLNAAPTAKAPELTLAQATQPAPELTVTPDPVPPTGRAPELTRDQLPATASPVPLVALLGALTLVGGALLLGRVKA